MCVYITCTNPKLTDCAQFHAREQLLCYSLTEIVKWFKKSDGQGGGYNSQRVAMQEMYRP